MLDQGMQLPQFRAEQTSKLQQLAKRCGPVDSEMKRVSVHRRHLSVRASGDNINVAFALALAAALQWPHFWLGRALLIGFPITGHLEETGVHRRLEEKLDAEEFNKFYVNTMRENRSWAFSVANAAVKRAKSGSCARPLVTKRIWSCLDE